MLNTKNAWGNSDTLFIFSQEYKVNVCVHMFDTNKDRNKATRVTYIHYKGNNSSDYIHLHLSESHYTPLLKIVKKG